MRDKRISWAVGLFLVGAISAAATLADEAPPRRLTPNERAFERAEKALQRAEDDQRFNATAEQEAQTQVSTAQERVATLEKDLRGANGDASLRKLLNGQLRDEKRKLSALRSELVNARRNHQIAERGLKRARREFAQAEKRHGGARSAASSH